MAPASKDIKKETSKGKEKAAEEMKEEKGETSEEKEKTDEEKKEKAEKAAFDLRKEAFQLANYYFVFQGVIFTAIYSPPTKFKCRYFWVPLTLSVLAGSLNLFALWVIMLKYVSILNKRDKDKIKGGKDLSVVKHEKLFRWVYLVLCMCAFIGFFGVTLAVSYVIPCDKHMYTPTNCVKLCDQEKCIKVCH